MNVFIKGIVAIAWCCLIISAPSPLYASDGPITLDGMSVVQMEKMIHGYKELCSGPTGLDECIFRDELPIIEKSGDGAVCVQVGNLNLHKYYYLRGRDDGKLKEAYLFGYTNGCEFDVDAYVNINGKWLIISKYNILDSVSLNKGETVVIEVRNTNVKPRNIMFCKGMRKPVDDRSCGKLNGGTSNVHRK